MLAAYCRSFLRAHGGNNSTAVDDCDSQGESHSAGSTPGEGGGGLLRGKKYRDDLRKS